MTSGGSQEVRLTREQLYERVWAEPMAVLAPQFGISDVALKKTCTKLRVPTPGRGYWAKKSAGSAVRRSPLPKLSASVPASSLAVTFWRTPKPPKGEIAEATGPVADQARYEAAPEHRILVPEVLTDPHSLVAASVHLLRKAKSDGQHRLSPRGKRCLAVMVTMGTVDRATCIYNSLIGALEERGYTLELTAAEQAPVTVVVIGEERVSIVIEERVDRVERKPDPSERRPVYYGREYDYTPTGRLTLRILHDYLNVRRSWGDGAKQRVEDCLNDVVVGIVAAAEAIKAQRIETEARHREYLAAEEQRRLAQQRREEEAGRVRALDASFTAWRKSEVIRQYVRAMRESAEAAGLLRDDTPIADWLRWAAGYADRLDPTQQTPQVPADPEPHRWPGYYRGAAGSTHEDPRPSW